MSYLPLLPKTHGLLYGGDYNPEQWPKSVWKQDMKLMRAAGVNLVSIGIFSWAKLQPNEKTYTFDWLDEVMDLLAANGIHADLATATASPPAWMSRYPDLGAMDANGVVCTHGSRQHYSPSSPTYRKFAAALVRKLAARYRKHPALAAWHINNEYGCHVAECHSPASTTAFRSWLKTRYGTLDALNDAWGTAFWSQYYHDWNDVLTPRKTATFPNPAQSLDFRRFSSDALLDLCKMERDILRKATPTMPITTNFMGFFKPLDYQAWAKEIDFTCWDSYPDPLETGAGVLYAARGHDLTRSLKPGRPFVLMEQVTSHVNWRQVNGTKPPGLMRLQSLQAVARGSDGVLFFQWRQSVRGAEKFHGAMVQHAPPTQSRVFREVCELGAELKKLAPVTGSLVRSRVAIVIDWAAWWALELPSKPTDLRYEDAIHQFHRYFYKRNLAVDFVAPGADLQAYAVVVAPQLYLLTKEDAKNLDAFVRGGGTLLTNFFSGIVDEKEQIIAGGYPAHLRKTLGLWVEEWFPLAEKETRKVRIGKNKLQGRTWSEVIHPEGAEVLATFGDGPVRDLPAITRHARGKGQALYLATRLDDNDLAEWMDDLLAPFDLRPPLTAPSGVEVAVREKGEERFLFLLNHRDKPAQLNLAEHNGIDLLTGQPVSAKLVLPPLGVAVVALKNQRGV